MKAAVVRATGETPVHADFAEPLAAPGEARVRVAASALSHLTRGRASGTHYSSSGGFPFVAGVDGTGVLDDGRRVYFVLPRAPFGGMAEETVVDIARILPLPDGLDLVTAAAIANPGMSSMAALVERARLKHGETVLINGATGASGSLAVKIARHLGAARVIATGRDATALEALGADATVQLGGDERVLDAALEAQFEGGVDVVLDYLWGPSARAALIAAARAGEDGVPMRFVQIGSASGGEIGLPAAVLRSSSIEMMGSGLGSVSLEGLIGAIARVFDVPGLALPVQAMPLADVAEAWAADDRAGRIVLTV
ncbi:zinc-binding alcohol dehydrogenase family protein [Sphingomonas sp.]|uniref:quinone oxidoreductase family protein n=1 Tax=Sphingomonas sp. TaxID=28214 RepID=UPI001B03E15A|nr:zinc-binding alcohol dehydrogenase family protein [Sphingomonas sp.]MBO9712277.1 zinc-binding alcohol dehydrogenase family protein [Sphingomonas sp.]